MKKAIVLAAGRGKRLGSITDNLPKPMVPVRGKPILKYVLSDLTSAGIDEVLLVVGYRQETIRDYFGDGEQFGCNMTYVEQAEANGTGAAIALGKEFANGHPAFVRFGDVLTDLEHTVTMVSDFEREPCDALMGCNFVEDPYAGAAVYRNGDRVTQLIEKPPRGTSTSNWNPAGLSIYGPRMFKELENLELSPRGEYEVTTALQNLINAGGNIRVHEMLGYWSDIGTPEALEEAVKRLATLTPAR